MSRGGPLLVLVCFAFFVSQTKSSDLYIQAPYFDEGENLSVQDCGNETTLDQWDVKVGSIALGHCDGIAISQRTVLIIKDCPFSGNDSLVVFNGDCWSRPEDEDCIRSSIKVHDVIEIGVHPTASQTQRLPFKVALTEKMPSEITPVCLFNRDNIIDLELQKDSPYFEWRILLQGATDWRRKKVIGQSDCLKKLKKKELESFKERNIPTKNIVCTKYKYNFLNNILVNLHGGRYFLRGIILISGPFYLDILPYIDEIAKTAKDISALRPITQPTLPKGFKRKDNLSFPNCGSKKQATRREAQDSSENVQVNPQIFNGNEAQQDGQPWHAFVENKVTGSICGGTLISPRAILTAAHCIHAGSNATNYAVSVGMYDKKQRKAAGVQRRKVQLLITHPNFSSENLSSDVALMILRKKIEITDHVHPICLWNEDSNLDRVAGIEATAVGFGLADNYTLPDKLQEVRLPIRAHKECYLSGRRFFGKYLRPGDNFCAGYTNGTTTCNGDSGGSLSVEKDGRWFIRGIVSFGMSKTVMFEGKERPLCHPNQYSLYSDVASYMDWIVENTPDISFRN